MTVDLQMSSHEEAMDLAQEGMLLQSRGDAGALEKFRQAFILERGCAEQAKDDKANEPTRSILHNSAARLALDCGEMSEALRIANRGLDGNPPAEIAEELREVILKAKV